jgi:hypothetical protein
VLVVVLVLPASIFFSLGSRDWVAGGAGERLAQPLIAFQLRIN